VKKGQDNYVYVRVLNRGSAAALNVTATVFWSPVATLVTPNLWTPVGSILIPIAKPNVMTVSDAIKWSDANIPAAGHYCFVGLVGNTVDPAPNPADFQNWDNYQKFIRNNNNVTWRNFNVMNTPRRQIDGKDYAVLDFIAPGTPSEDRQMQLAVVSNLPKGGRILLEGPADFLDLLESPLPAWREDERHGRMVRVSPRGRSVVGQGLFPADSRTALRLLVHVPEEFGEERYNVYVSQIFEDLEVGRVTWRLKSFATAQISSS